MATTPVVPPLLDVATGAGPRGPAPWSCSVRRTPTPVLGLPAREVELLCLLLDVLVVQLRALVGRVDPGADGNGQLLELRALDWREELEGRGGQPCVDIRLHVLDGHGHVVGKLRALDHVGTGWGDRGAHRLGAFDGCDIREELL